MILRTFDNRLLLVLHQPNSSPHERARFFELRDTGDTLTIHDAESEHREYLRHG